MEKESTVFYKKNLKNQLNFPENPEKTAPAVPESMLQLQIFPCTGFAMLSGSFPFFVRSERRLQRLRKEFCIKKQPLPKRIFFISFEKSSGNNQKCLRTLGKLRSLCTKMLFQNFQVLQQPLS